MKLLEAWRIDSNGRVVAVPDDGMPVSGMSALMQRVLMALLQETGSSKYSFGKRTSSGCNLLQLLRFGELRSEADLFAHFNLCRYFVHSELKATETDDDPPEERFKDVRLTGIEFEPSNVVLRISIWNQAQDLLQISLPISTKR